MTEKTFNLHHTIIDDERGRDAYGFALRPQHVQRYREYANFYKEEEEERSDKWKSFLEQQASFNDSCLTEEESRKSSQTEDTELREEAVLERGGESDDTCKKTSDSEKSTECGLEKEVQSSEEPKKEVQSPKELEKEVQSSQEPEKEVQSSEGPEEVRSSEGPEEEDWSLEQPEKEIQRSDKSKEEVQPSELPEKQVQPSKKPEKELQHLKDSESEENSSEKPEEEVHLFKEPVKEHKPPKPKRKIERWSQIRPSLCVLESVMSGRVTKGKNLKGRRKGRKDHLPSTQEKGSPEGETMEDIHEVVCDEEAEDDKVNVSEEETTKPNEASPESFSAWKEELEFLVRGGVPKDIRGEVWQAFVGVKARRVESYYEDLLSEESKAYENNDANMSNELFRKWRKQIEKDLPRTFPGHPALNDHGRESLRRVLLAYARHNPSVGYCQAMNFFAGLLLLLMPEENAFWTLVGIIDDYFDGYYTEEMLESQVDQLVFEELMRERFPKLVNHLDYLGVQVAWFSGPWFLSIFLNMIPWESVLRVWDVLLFEGNRVMLFRTALALMELYGPALITTKDAGDAITLLQSLAGSTFDSSQLVLTACMGFLAVTEARLQQLREKHRPSILEIVDERSKKGKVWKDSKGLASKLYSFKHDPGSLVEETKTSEGEKPMLEPHSSSLDDLLSGIAIDSEVDSLPDLQEQVVWLKVELCRLLEEKRSAILRAEELETALMEMVKQDNRRQLSAKVELLEQEVADLRQALADKKEQEAAMLQVLMRMEQEQRITEEARLVAEQDAAAQRHTTHTLQEKYNETMASLAQMEKRVVMAESMLEATVQYEKSQAKALSSPRAGRNQNTVESPRRRLGLFGLGWRDKNKGRPTPDELGENSPSNSDKDPSNLQKESNEKEETNAHM